MVAAGCGTALHRHEACSTQEKLSGWNHTTPTPTPPTPNTEHLKKEEKEEKRRLSFSQTFTTPQSVIFTGSKGFPLMANVLSTFASVSMPATTRPKATW